MNIFVAGGSGAIGRQLVPMLVGEGHRVVGLTRSPAGARRLQSMGATAVVGDVFDRARLDELVKEAEPEVVLHQLTAFGATDADPLAETIRIRKEGTRNLVEAAAKAGARRFLAQSISFICRPVESGLTDERSPLHLEASPAIRPLAEAVAELEDRALGSVMEGVVLRYGWFYGPGTNHDPGDAVPRAILQGRMPIVGRGEGTYSFVHVRDAAAATMKALHLAAPGIYNVVDDEPAKLCEWLPFVADLLGAPAPGSMDADLARRKLGDMMVYVFEEQSGASNRKARQMLGWTPDPASWRTGFPILYGSV
jgi:nucleoside-diphosphate-sugar epimerase